MGKIEQAVKTEITRLAKKEIRAICNPLARDVRELKREVSRLSKTVAKLEKLGAEIEAERMEEKAKLEAPAAEVKAARFSAGLIKKLRARLGLTQVQLASLVGVTGTAVTFWEQGKSKPQGQNREALVALRKLGKRDVQKMLAEK
jgi:DNA-binding transcriptional regulator YiaG